MQIYVQSRGFGQADGVHWLPEEPLILKNNRVSDLIQSEAHSVVLARYNDRLILLVTGLESGRIDFRDRQIRNSVVWSGGAADEPTLRALAIRALNGLLAEEIDRAISFGGKWGFDVQFAALHRLALLEPVQNHAPDERRIIAPNCTSQIRKLAVELQQHRLPAWQNCPLVVVTGIKAKSVLESALVWRGLSSLVEREFVYPPPKFASRHHQHSEEKPLALIMLIVVIAGIMLLGIL